MPFGLRFLSQIFQRILNEVTQGLDFIFFYLDDILVCSKDEQEHLDNLNVLFERLDSFGINLEPPKCLFGVKTPTFLRHKVSLQFTITHNNWTVVCEESFNTAKNLLAVATSLAHFNPKATLFLPTDASNVAIGAIR